MNSEQIAVRLSESLLGDLDALVSNNVYKSRAAAVRAGIEAIMELEQRRTTDEAIIEGYRRNPPTTMEDEAAFESLKEAILDEPW